MRGRCEMRATVALTRVETLLFLRNPTSIFMAMLPALLLLLQAYVIPGTMNPIGGPDPNAAALRPIDFFVPVAVTVAIASVAITNYPSSVGSYRETGILRRLGVTPVGAHRVLLAQWVVSGMSLAAAFLLTMTIAWLAIGASAPSNATIAAVAVIFGTIAMMSLGSVLAAIAPNAHAAYGLGLIVFMATMFTAGMWTPGPLMPETIRIISGFTPMGAMTQALTDAWYAGTVSLVPFIVMTAWALLASALAVKIFRWV